MQRLLGQLLDDKALPNELTAWLAFGGLAQSLDQPALAERIVGERSAQRAFDQYRRDTGQALPAGAVANRAILQFTERLLASAVTDRSQVPTRFGEDPAELTSLLKSAETLDAFAQGIAQMEQDIGAPMADFEAAQGSLPLPAMGTVLREPGQPDARGVKRPGLTLGTAPAALVTAPWPATIRYRGPLLDYGNVMIVEPAGGYLLVLAGLAQVFGETGDVVAAGEPLGLMGGQEGAASEFGAAFVEAAAGGKLPNSSQQLYVELRRGKETLDPAEWFVMNPVIAAAPSAAETTAETTPDTPPAGAPGTEQQVRTTE